MVLSLPEKLVYNTGSQKGAEDEKEKLLAACRFNGNFYFFQFRCFRRHVQRHEPDGQRMGPAGIGYRRPASGNGFFKLRDPQAGALQRICFVGLPDRRRLPASALVVDEGQSLSLIHISSSYVFISSSNS